MDIDYLNEFLRLEKHDSISKAATAMGISQPVLSRHIQSLERDLGVALLERSGQRMRYTGAGKVLLARLQEMIPYWQLTRRLTMAAGKNHYKLHLGGDVHNPLARGRLYAAMELAEIALTPMNIEMESNAHFEDLLTGALDLLVSYVLPDDVEGLDRAICKPLCSGNVSAVLMKGHSLCAKEELEVTDLNNQRIIKLTGSYFSYGLWWNTIRDNLHSCDVRFHERSVYVRDSSTMPMFYIGEDVFLCPSEGVQGGFWHANPLYDVRPIRGMKADIYLYHLPIREDSALSEFLGFIDRAGEIVSKKESAS